MLPELGRCTLPPIELTYDSETEIVLTMPPMISGAYIAGMARHLFGLDTVFNTDWGGDSDKSTISIHGDFSGRSAHGDLLSAAVEFWDEHSLNEMVYYPSTDDLQID
jgi:hypothetical protein